MSISLATLALARNYTKESLVGLGALKGASCTIKEITKENKINKIIFEWIGTDNSKKTSEMLINDGEDIVAIEVNENNEVIVTLSNNISYVAGRIKTLQGEEGFSPKITENKNNTNDIYKLDIETKEGIITTPNLIQQGSVQIVEF